MATTTCSTISADARERANLATRYLDATERYLALYEPMLGDYPFSKFALVENFWETGYGMPSFTLLGEQIIRFLANHPSTAQRVSKRLAEYFVADEPTAGLD